eukprot:Amastigsp_a341977_47.p4 type:complete len:158 gc:universal Amastigsp_a341977_47:872-399(-)
MIAGRAGENRCRCGMRTPARADVYEPSKGKALKAKQKRVAPRAHVSTRSSRTASEGTSNSSGALNAAVQYRDASSCSSRACDREVTTTRAGAIEPRSMTTGCPSRSSRMLSGLMSRCACGGLAVWSTLMASRTSAKTARILASDQSASGGAVAPETM